MKKKSKTILTWTILVILLLVFANQVGFLSLGKFQPTEMNCALNQENKLECSILIDKVQGAGEYEFIVNNPKFETYNPTTERIIKMYNSWFNEFTSRNSLKEQFILNLRFNTEDTSNKYSIKGESCKPNDCNGAVESYDEGCGLYKADASYSKSLCGQYGCDTRSTYQESLCSQIGGTFSYSGNIFYCRNAFTTCGGKIYSSPFELSYMPYQISDKVYPAFYEFPYKNLVEQFNDKTCVYSGNATNEYLNDRFEFYFEGKTKIKDNLQMICLFDNVMPKKLADNDDYYLDGKVFIDLSKNYTYNQCFQNLDCGDETALSSICKTDGKYVTYNRPSCVMNKCSNATAEIRVGECDTTEPIPEPVKKSNKTIYYLLGTIVAIFITLFYLVKKRRK